MRKYPTQAKTGRKPSLPSATSQICDEAGWGFIRVRTQSVEMSSRHEIWQSQSPCHGHSRDRRQHHKQRLIGLLQKRSNKNDDGSVDAAFDMFGVGGQGNILHERSTFRCEAATFDNEILNQRHTVAGVKNCAIAVNSDLRCVFVKRRGGTSRTTPLDS